MNPTLSPFSIGFYDPKRKIILKSGNSRACGYNHNKISIHAEQLAIEFCRKHDKRNKYKIFIGRYAKDGHLKPAYCCHACSQLANKYNYQDRIFTFKDNEKISAVVDNPSVSLGNMLRNL